MYALCCWFKIFYYIFLIIYHVCDVFIDWTSFVTGNFAGVPINSTLNPWMLSLLTSSYDASGNTSTLNASDECGSSTNTDFKGLPLKVPFLFSCGFGTVSSMIMIRVYFYIIKFHRNCIRKDCKSSSRHLCYQKFSQHFLSAELWISLIMELLLKDDIQSYLLFWISKCQSSLLDRSLSSLALWMAVCSVVAHLKLSICFFTKLSNLGVAEKIHYLNGTVKVSACLIGILGSVLCLRFTLTFLGLDPLLYLKQLKIALTNLTCALQQENAA